MPVSSSSVLLPALFITFSTSLLLPSAAVHHHHHRHLLHEQNPPHDSLPRTTTQSTDPSLPSPPPPDYPFFPETSIPLPPPPPPPPSPPSNAPFASFPANISALTLPQYHKSSKGASSKIFAGAFAAVVAAIILVVVSTFLHFRKRRNRELVDANTSKSNRFEENRSRLHHNNSVNLSTGAIPVLERPLKLSSEFLYLGTLVDSHGGIDYAVDHSHSVSDSTTSSSSAAPGGSSSFSNLRRIGSPELRPLPPLKGKNVGLNDGNSELCSCSEGDYENDDLYSLKWSGMGRNNSIRTDPAAELGKFDGDCSCSSFSSSSSASRSPLRSTSLSVSPPESVSIELIPPQLPISHPVIPTETDTVSKSSCTNQKESPSPSEFPSVLTSLASPARCDSRSRESSPRCSNFSDYNFGYPVKISSPDHHASALLPPARPPPSPPLCNKHLEIPRTPPQEDDGFVFDPPVSTTPPQEDEGFVFDPPISATPPQEDNSFVFDPLVLATPVRPLSVENHTLISATQSNSYFKDTQNKERILDLGEKTNDNAEKKMENPYVKMGPLQWDKA